MKIEESIRLCFVLESTIKKKKKEVKGKLFDFTMKNIKENQI